MSSSDQPKTSSGRTSLLSASVELAFALFLGSMENVLVYLDPHLSTANMQNLFIGFAAVSVVLAVLGMGTMVFYVLKYIQRSLLLVVLFAAATFLIGVTFSLTAYTEYDLAQTKCQPDETANQKSIRDNDAPNNVSEQKTESSPEAG